MKKTEKRKVFPALCALTIFLAAGCAGRDAGNGAEESKFKEDTAEAGSVSAQESSGTEGTAAPEEIPSVVFECPDMEGNTVTSDIFSESKLTMVNVWATYCNPCLNEMPALGELAAEYDSEEFQLIGIVSNVQENASEEMMQEAAKLIEQTGADYTHLILNESVYYALLTDVSAVPTTFFVNEEGQVLGAVIGAKDKTTWKEIIDGLLEEL